MDLPPSTISLGLDNRFRKSEISRLKRTREIRLSLIPCPVRIYLCAASPGKDTEKVFTRGKDRS